MTFFIYGKPNTNKEWVQIGGDAPHNLLLTLESFQDVEDHVGREIDRAKREGHVYRVSFSDGIVLD